MIEIQDPVLAGELGICAQCSSRLRINTGLPWDTREDDEINVTVRKLILDKEPKCPNCHRILTPVDFGFEEKEGVRPGLWEKKQWVKDGQWVPNKPADFFHGGFRPASTP